MGEGRHTEHTETDADDIDVNAVIGRIRAELARRQETRASAPSSSGVAVVDQSDQSWYRYPLVSS